MIFRNKNDTVYVIIKRGKKIVLHFDLSGKLTYKKEYNNTKKINLYNFEVTDVLQLLHKLQTNINF